MPKLKTQILPAVFIAAATFGITLILTSLSFFAFIELKGLDLLFALRGPLPPDLYAEAKARLDAAGERPVEDV